MTTGARDSLCEFVPPEPEVRYGVWFWDAGRGATWRRWNDYSTLERAREARAELRTSMPEAQLLIAVKTTEWERLYA